MGKKILVLSAIVLAIVLGACDNTPVANNDLEGMWVATSGESLTFNMGRLTRRTMFGDAEIGTYETDGGNIIFKRDGFPTETLAYYVIYPRLFVGDAGKNSLEGERMRLNEANAFFHDVPGSVAAIVEGTWIRTAPSGSGGSTWGAAVVFGKAEAKRDSGGVLEGDYTWIGRQKGKYTISGRNVPNRDRLVITPTHIHGQQLYEFLSTRLQMHLQVLFDVRDLVNPPAGLRDEWWLSAEEARRYFIKAIEDAPEGTERLTIEQLVYASRLFFSEFFTPEIYAYGVSHNVDVRNDASKPVSEQEFPMGVREGDNWLILVEITDYGNYFYYYYKKEEARR